MEKGKALTESSSRKYLLKRPDQTDGEATRVELTNCYMRYAYKRPLTKVCRENKTILLLKIEIQLSGLSYVTNILILSYKSTFAFLRSRRFRSLFISVSPLYRFYKIRYISIWILLNGFIDIFTKRGIE